MGKGYESKRQRWFLRWGPSHKRRDIETAVSETAVSRSCGSRARTIGAKFTALHFLPRSMSNSDGCQRAFATATAYAAHFTANLPLPKVTRFQMGRCPMPQQMRQLPVIELLSGFGAEPQLSITPEFKLRFCAWIARRFRRSGSGAPLTSIGVSFFRTGEKLRPRTIDADAFFML